MQSIITITTDFGDQFAASQLRAVTASLGFDGQIIENHGVTPFAITEGAFQIQQIARFSPIGSVHVGVIDPGVGSGRWGVVIQTTRSWFVGPNNGLLCPVASLEGIEQIWRLDEQAFGPEVTNTFHGRDVFIKAAVYLAQGKPPTEFGSIKITEQELEKVSLSLGEVVHIDAYGNYKIHWPRTLIAGKQLQIKTKQGKAISLPVVKTFNDVKPNQPLALHGSHGTLEIAINLASAAEYFQFRLGEKLVIRLV